MKSSVIQIERIFDSSSAAIWKALTDKHEMKKWYFDLKEFKAEIGFIFSFTGGPSPEKQYVHLCEVIEVIPQQKLTYSWAYAGYIGVSYVSFELSPQADQTLLRLTHVGIDTFPKTEPDFDISNFTAGWNHIIYTSLKEYMESIKQ